MSDEQAPASTPASSSAPAGGSPLAMFDNFLGFTAAARMLTLGVFALVISFLVGLLGGLLNLSSRPAMSFFSEVDSFFFNLGLILVIIGLVRELANAKR